MQRECVWVEGNKHIRACSGTIQSWDTHRLMQLCLGRQILSPTATEKLLHLPFTQMQRWPLFFSPSLQITPFKQSWINPLTYFHQKWLLSPVFQLSCTQWIVNEKISLTFLTFCYSLWIKLYFKMESEGLGSSLFLIHIPQLLCIRTFNTQVKIRNDTVLQEGKSCFRFSCASSTCSTCLNCSTNFRLPWVFLAAPSFL